MLTSHNGNSKFWYLQTALTIFSIKIPWFNIFVNEHIIYTPRVLACNFAHLIRSMQLLLHFSFFHKRQNDCQDSTHKKPKSFLNKLKAEGIILAMSIIVKDVLTQSYAKWIFFFTWLIPSASVLFIMLTLSLPHLDSFIIF